MPIEPKGLPEGCGYLLLVMVCRWCCLCAGAAYVLHASSGGAARICRSGGDRSQLSSTSVARSTLGPQRALRSQVDEAQARIAQLDVELQRVRRANGQLSDACAALQEANAEGVGDAHLINKAMLAELEGLRAARAADVAETSAILAALGPLIDGATDDSDTAQEENA